MSSFDSADAKVNCGSCSACCRREVVALVEGDIPENYPLAERWPREALSGVLPNFVGLVIPHGADGACVYLKNDKCSIYDRRPKVCRAFTCVGFVESILAATTRAERRRDPPLKAIVGDDVWRAGIARRATR